MSAADDLQELAAFGHGRVTPADHRYPGVQEPFVARCQSCFEGVKLSAYSGHELLLIDFPIGSPVALALGRPDEFLVGARVRISGIGPPDAFSSTDDLAEASIVLTAPEVRAKVAALALADDEQVLVAANKTCFVMRASGLAEDLRRLTILLDLVGLLGVRQIGGGSDAEDTRLTALAGVSADDLAFLGRWAISDDDEREHALATAQENDLVALARFLEDHGNALDDRIEELDTTDPSSAALWGAVGETAAEAKMELTRRHQTN